MAKDPLANLTVEELSEIAAQYRGDQSEDGLRMSAKIRSRMRRLSHDDIHPGEEYFTVNIPRSVTGEAFSINDHEYLGECEVPACVLQTLMHMVYQNRKIDQERMRDNGQTIDLGIIGERISQIQRE